MHRRRWVWDPQCELSTVVNHSMWSEIPWIRSGRQAVGQLRGEYPYVRLSHSVKMPYSPNLHGRLIFILMCSKWLIYLYKQRCCPAEHLLKITPIWVWLLNVAVRESWVLSNKLMKGPGVRRICSKPRGSRAAAQYRFRLCVKLWRRKLVVQGIVHYSSCWLV